MPKIFFKEMMLFLNDPINDSARCLKQPFGSAWCLMTCLDAIMTYAIIKKFSTGSDSANNVMTDKIVHRHYCEFIRDRYPLKKVIDKVECKSYVYMLDDGFADEERKKSPPGTNGANSMYFPPPIYFCNTDYKTNKGNIINWEAIVRQMRLKLNNTAAKLGFEEQDFQVNRSEDPRMLNTAMGPSVIIEFFKTVKPGEVRGWVLVIGSGVGLSHAVLICGYDDDVSNPSVYIYDPEISKFPKDISNTAPIWEPNYSRPNFIIEAPTLPKKDVNLYGLDNGFCNFIMYGIPQLPLHVPQMYVLDSKNFIITC